MMSFRRPRLILLALLVPTVVLALPWSRDMRDQPSIQPQQAIVELPANSVPAQRREPVAPPRDAAELVRARLRAAALNNPAAADAESLQRGLVLYQTHCLSCHGNSGRGDGPVGEKYIPEPIDLTIRYIQNQPDGQIFYTVSHGGVIMPYYRDSIAVEDRWHLVNYIKHGLGEQ